MPVPVHTISSPNGLQRPVFYGLAAVVFLGTAYSVVYGTYLDTSNPLLSNLPHPLQHTHYFASKRNPLNVYFIKKAWGWTSAVFLFSWFTGPRERNSSRRLWTYLALTGLWLVFTSWFFGPAILERVVAASGGECVLPGPSGLPMVVPNEYCFTKSTISAQTHPELFTQFSTANVGDEDPADSNPLIRIEGVPRLRKGHDVSGHIFLLTMSILLLTEQLQASLGVHQRLWSGVHKVAVVLNAMLVALWMWSSAVTSVYFHSPLEKFTGFALGLMAYGLTQLPYYFQIRAQTLAEPLLAQQARGTCQAKANTATHATWVAATIAFIVNRRASPRRVLFSALVNSAMKPKAQHRSLWLSSRTRSSFYSHTVRINALRVIWAAAVVWGELGVFYWSVRHCRWPGGQVNPQTMSHVLLLSDTQVQHPALQTGSESWTARLRIFLFTLTLKKSWHVTAKFKPDLIVFLGDMLANGRGAKSESKYANFQDNYQFTKPHAESSSTRYSKAVQKFKSIFVSGSAKSVYYVPGNNDIWLGEITPYAKAIRHYYTNSFGPPSQAFDVQNHTFVILDAPGLVDEDYLRAGKGVSFARWTPLPAGAVSFVREISDNRTREGNRNSVVLLSHIPLARPEMASCGPLRERGTVRRNVGHGYQSMLGRQTTSFLLQTLKPLAVYSGDNRDYCEYNHTIPDDEHSIREVTLKSFSPSAHIRRPGFQLLSVTSPYSASQRQPTIADVPCFLPDQSQIYNSLYIPLACLTLILFLAFNTRGSRLSRNRSSPWHLPPIRPFSSSSLASSRSVSGHSTPIHQSPWSPSLGTMGAARTSGFPGTVRTSIQRQTSVPESPFAYAARATTSLDNDENEEDPMQPAQYAICRDSHRSYDDHDYEDWSDIRRQGGGSAFGGGPGVEELEFDLVGLEHGNSESALLTQPLVPGPRSSRMVPQSVSAPDDGSRPSRTPIWSYSFVLGGKMRRITVRRPTTETLNDLVELLKGNETRRYRGSTLGATVADALSVAWAPLFVWWLIISFVL
ncbi:hypothetical protein NMY22_g594 [Coprinellus aureogranulatus]|nr:hypothetical protein NMY22_g594 [Coprinellus aureogranulatus]